MRKARVRLIGGLMILLLFQPAWAQKETFHSIFIYNFSKYVKWPDTQNSGKFVIGVYGSSKIEKDLKTMASSKKVSGMPIEVKVFKSTEGIRECQILYISASESGDIDQIVSSTANDPILIVTDKPGLAQKGSTINFVEIEGKIKFELNQQEVESRGLKVASSLTSLAIII